jgi:hypothetical protein
MTSPFHYLQTNDLVTYNGLIHRVMASEERHVDAALFCGYSVMSSDTPASLSISYRRDRGAVLVQAPNQTCLVCAYREALNDPND